MRKAAARGSGANKSAVRIGLVVVCVGLGREFEARLGAGSLVWGQEGAPRAGAGIVVSCGGSDEKGWRTELELGRGKSLDDHHAAATLGTEPKCAGFLDRGGFWFGWRWRYCAEELQAKRQESGAPPVGEEAKVADADEAFGQQVQEEAAQELIER